MITALKENLYYRIILCRYWRFQDSFNIDAKSDIIYEIDNSNPIWYEVKHSLILPLDYEMAYSWHRMKRLRKNLICNSFIKDHYSGAWINWWSIFSNQFEVEGDLHLCFSSKFSFLQRQPKLNRCQALEYLHFKHVLKCNFLQPTKRKVF